MSPSVITKQIAVSDMQQNDSPADTSARPAEEEPERKCLLVLGMHRSGTSALTRVLNLAGASLPEHVLGPDEIGNPRGHWEPEKLMQYHDRMLFELGSSWHDWRPLNLDTISETHKEKISKSIKEIIEQEFKNDKFFVIKEPRICRFSDFFIKTLHEMNIGVFPIITWRNPLEVLASLEKRNGMRRDKAALLWLRHVLDAEKATRDLKRVFVNYEGLIKEWRSTVEKIKKYFPTLEWKSTEEIEKKVESFLTPELRHNEYDLEEVDDDPLLSKWVAKCCNALIKFENESNNEDAMRTMDEVDKEISNALPYLTELEMKLQQHEEENRKLHGHIKLMEEEIRNKNDNIEIMNAKIESQINLIESMKRKIKEIEDINLKISKDLFYEKALSRKYKKELDAIQNTISWKIIRPIINMEMRKKKKDI